MLSIIICSRNAKIPEELERNIQETVSADFEFVIINNAAKELSIFEAYNNGIAKSQGDILVFLHDDVLFKTTGWGEILEDIFSKNADLGLLGIAGSTIKTKMPSLWWTSTGKIIIRIIQHHKNGRPMEIKNSGFSNSDLVEVAVIDGVFMAMRRDERIAFDSKLTGFHNYDLDLSLKQHLLLKKVCVTNNILIEHFSGGTIDREWYISASHFHKINHFQLPIIIAAGKEMDIANREFSVGAAFVKGLVYMNLNREALYWWFQLVRMKPKSKFHFKFLYLFFNSLTRGRKIYC